MCLCDFQSNYLSVVTGVQFSFLLILNLVFVSTFASVYKYLDHIQINTFKSFNLNCALKQFYFVLFCQTFKI